MLPESFYQIPNYESIVQITSTGLTGTHVKNIWNIYVFLTEDDKILIPFEDFSNTEQDLKFNGHIKLSIRNAEVENSLNRNLPGIGFLISGTGQFTDSGEYFELIREKYPRAISALIVTVGKCKQML